MHMWLRHPVVSILFIKMDREFHLHVKYRECLQTLLSLYILCNWIFLSEERCDPSSENTKYCYTVISVFELHCQWHFKRKLDMGPDIYFKMSTLNYITMVRRKNSHNFHPLDIDHPVALLLSLSDSFPLVQKLFLWQKHAFSLLARSGVITLSL